jgi:ABC-2 type transport system ATP-binding protein
VRLGLVLALAHRPELVILDDPALGLDPIMRKQFNRDLITHLQGEGRTVFYSSHLLYEVEPVADEVAILDEGRIVRQADTETLRRDVKQLQMSREAYAVQRKHLSVLDGRSDGERMVAVVYGAEKAVELLRYEGVDFRVVDLNLDEIFEAYVVGRRDDPATEAQPQAELQPLS